MMQLKYSSSVRIKTSVPIEPCQQVQLHQVHNGDLVRLTMQQSYKASRSRIWQYKLQLQQQSISNTQPCSYKRITVDIQKMTQLSGGRQSKI